MHRLGDFEIVRQLAQGGMATVYVAARRGTAGFTKPVALKVVHEQYEGDEDFLKMFLDEARLSARIAHPNVVSVHELAKDGERYFLVMELVEGCSLLSLLRALRERARRVDARIAVHIASEIAAGLHAAHEATNDQGTALHIVHRDVSPSNVLISYDGFVKVCDFGVAKASLRLRRTTGHAVRGKVRYMAPEQARGEDVDRRTDIYALGLLTFELLTGRPRFMEAAPDLLLGSVQRPEALRVDSVEPMIGKALADVVAKALEPERSQRFPTARELREAMLEALPEARTVDHADLAALLGDVEVSAPPVDVTAQTVLAVQLPPSIPPEARTRPVNGAIAAELAVDQPASPMPAALANAIEKLGREPRPARPPDTISGNVPGVLVDPERDRREAVRQTAPAIGVGLAGGALLVVGLAIGRSAFLGTGDLFSVVLDALGLGAIVTAALRISHILTGRVGIRDLRMVGAATIVLSYAAMFGLNHARRPSVVRATIAAPRAPVAEARDPQGPEEARAYLAGPDRRFARTSPARARALVEAIYGAGATSVFVVTPTRVGSSLVVDRLQIEAPPDRRAAIEEAALRHLGLAAQELDRSLLAPPERGPWILPVGYD